MILGFGINPGALVSFSGLMVVLFSLRFIKRALQRRRVRCPFCDHQALVFRRGWFKDGWTCRGCGAQLDWYGNVEHLSPRQTLHFQELTTKFLPESPPKLKNFPEPNHSTQEMPGDCEKGKGSPHG
jgi:hypothetical protein